MKTKLDSWVKEILVDPLGKDKLYFEADKICNVWGKNYPVHDCIPDFSIIKDKDWFDGQEGYKKWFKEWMDFSPDFFESEYKNDAEIYRIIPVNGRCLDVGGGLGTLRAFIENESDYVSYDPFYEQWKLLPDKSNIALTFKCVNDPVNFISGNAEHLPFISASFDNVHMRSVLDHLHDPQLALYEAYRVLKSEGNLIIMLTVNGGKGGPVLTHKMRLAKTLKPIIPNGLINYYHKKKSEADHHSFHPTYSELSEMISKAGFKITKTIWPGRWNDSVCFIEGVK